MRSPLLCILYTKQRLEILLVTTILRYPVFRLTVLYGIGSICMAEDEDFKEKVKKRTLKTRWVFRIQEDVCPDRQNGVPVLQDKIGRKRLPANSWS